MHLLLRRSEATQESAQRKQNATAHAPATVSDGSPLRQVRTDDLAHAAQVPLVVLLAAARRLWGRDSCSAACGAACGGSACIHALSSSIVLISTSACRRATFHALCVCSCCRTGATETLSVAHSLKCAACSSGISHCNLSDAVQSFSITSRRQGFCMRYKYDLTRGVCP